MTTPVDPQRSDTSADGQELINPNTGQPETVQEREARLLEEDQQQ